MSNNTTGAVYTGRVKQAMDDMVVLCRLYKEEHGGN